MTEIAMAFYRIRLSEFQLLNLNVAYQLFYIFRCCETATATLPATNSRPEFAISPNFTYVCYIK